MLAHVLLSRNPNVSLFELNNIACRLGYRFFMWEDFVYVVAKDGRWLKTDVAAAELTH